MFCRHIYIGINGAADTLVSQAYGQNELRLCGTYLNRGRLINTVILIPIIVLLSCSEKILIAIGQDETVAQYASTYIIPMIPGMYFFGQYDLMRRFLTCIDHAVVPMVT